MLKGALEYLCYKTLEEDDILNLNENTYESKYVKKT